MSSVVAFAAFLAVVGSPASTDGSTHSTDTEDVAERRRAEASFERGQSLFQAAKYDEALLAFQRAMVLSPAPALHYNIALCYSRLGEDTQAIESFETYLTLADPEDRGDIEHLIREAQGRIEARKGTTSSLALEEARSTSTASPVTDRSVAHRPLIVAGGTLTAVGVVLGIAGSVAFGAAVQKHNRSVDAFNEGRSGLTTREAFDHEKKAYRFEGLQYASIGVGVAATVAGVAILAVGLRRRARANERLAGLRVAPFGSGRESGLALSGRF